MYTKNTKKSRHFNRRTETSRARLVDRKDIFLVLAIFILIAAPFFINLFFNMYTAANQINLYISAHFEELFGKEMTENLLQEYMEQNPDVRIRMENNTAEPDILLLKEGHSCDLAIPLISFMDLLFYNIDILSAAGFDRPPGTRNEFLAYVRAVSNSDFGDNDNENEENGAGAVGAGAVGTALSLSRDDPRAIPRDIFSWIWAAAGNFWSGEETPSLNAAIVTNTITFFRTLYNEGLLAPDIFETTGEQRLEQFAQGKIAMMITSTQAIPYLRERMGDNAFGITTIPDPGTGGIYSIYLSSIYAGINPNTTYPEKALNFLEFLAGKSSLFNTELKAVPGAAFNIIPGDYVIDDPFYSKAWDIFEYAQIVEGFSGKSGAQKYEAAFLEELLIFFETNRTAQQTVTAIQQRWDNIEQ